uniref:Putative secreted protein n=1 Tax=Anopheles triannulatus TaxID=58253 RepID=A0A2M4B3H5_9DIPT
MNILASSTYYFLPCILLLKLLPLVLSQKPIRSEATIYCGTDLSRHFTPQTAMCDQERNCYLHRKPYVQQTVFMDRLTCLPTTQILVTGRIIFSTSVRNRCYTRIVNVLVQCGGG